MPAVVRILDANLNRAREALRVMEEAARFLLNQSSLTASLKQLRHDLSLLARALPDADAWRDTPGDVGADLSTPQELARASAADVVLAAGKRLSEALRTLEEFGKLLPDSIGAEGFALGVKRLRYRAYTLERDLNRAARAWGAQPWRLCLVLTASACSRHPWELVLDAAVEAGADCVQVREKEMDGGWLLERVQRVVERVGRRAAVVVNDRPDVALAAGADGVHVGQTDLPPLAVRRVVGRQLLLGVSCSNAGHAARAFERGADYCGLGPMFPSSTKARDFVAGPSLLRAFHEAFPERPYLAIGGITPDNVGELARAGCRGVAVCAAVCGSVDPGLAVRRLLEALPSPVSPDEPAGPSDEAAAST